MRHGGNHGANERTEARGKAGRDHDEQCRRGELDGQPGVDKFEKFQLVFLGRDLFEPDAQRGNVGHKGLSAAG